DARLLLVDSRARLLELQNLNLGNVELLSSLDDVNEAIDLCVVSTSCESRLAIYKRCLELNPRYIILEKYLFKSREEFEECLALDRLPTFVNQWLYGSKAFDCIFEEEVRSVELIGSNWGMACNAVHWIDVFKRHMKITHLQAGSDTRISKVFPSKRAGYEEIHGELVFTDRDSDKTFRLVDHGDESLAGMQEFRLKNKVYLFDFTKITLNRKVISHFPYLSDLIGEVVGEILQNGRSHLPSLEESISQHLLIEDMLEKLDRRPNIT
ncbi:MAG: hypothetical protein WBN40_02460, partial [Pseudomonadales bacterium]